MGKIESEKIIDRYLREHIKKLGGWSIKLLAVHISGLPDRLCLLPFGRIFFAEIKTTGEEPSPIQRLVHKKLRVMGFRVEVIDTTERVKEILKDYE